MSYQIYLRPAYPNELYHHGVKGQKWGVRRFQNPDGTLTAAGKKRYDVGAKGVKRLIKDARAENRQVERQTTATGNIYQKTIRDRDAANAVYSAVSNKSTKKALIAERKAQLDDANRRVEFWKKQNEQAVKDAEQSTKRLNKILKSYGAKPLDKIPTRTLDNGQKVVDGVMYTKGEKAKGIALTAASMVLGAATATLIGSPIIFYGDFVPSKTNYQNERASTVERDSGYVRNKNVEEFRRKKKQGYYK